MALIRLTLTPALLAPAVLALGLLAGCGAGLPALPGLGGGTAVNLDTVPRAKIEAFGTPIMRATIPGLGIDTLLSPRDRKGDLVTWESADGYTFTFRDGVLVETRGLGPDLMSAAAPGAGQIASGGATSRTYFYTWENDANQRRDYTCSGESRGQVVVTIYGRQHTTRNVVESCLREGNKLLNEFWFEGGKIRQSRQWISPLAGPGWFFLVVG